MCTIAVRPNGDIQFIYTDELLPLMAEGVAVVQRASHVEPSGTGGWSADLGPVLGPTLGPFPTRAAALDAEVTWLNTHHIYRKG